MARASAASDAPTQSTLGAGSAHGQVGVLSSSTPSLPAETTYRVAGWAAIASDSARDGDDDPREALTTGTPAAPTASNAAAIPDVQPWPLSSSTRNGVTW